MKKRIGVGVGLESQHEYIRDAYLYVVFAFNRILMIY